MWLFNQGIALMKCQVCSQEWLDLQKESQRDVITFNPTNLTFF